MPAHPAGFESVTLRLIRPTRWRGFGAAERDGIDSESSRSAAIKRSGLLIVKRSDIHVIATTQISCGTDGV
jgi:hypothetical protein